MKKVSLFLLLAMMAAFTGCRKNILGYRGVDEYLMSYDVTITLPFVHLDGKREFKDYKLPVSVRQVYENYNGDVQGNGELKKLMGVGNDLKLKPNKAGDLVSAEGTVFPYDAKRQAWTVAPKKDAKSYRGFGNLLISMPYQHDDIEDEHDFKTIVGIQSVQSFKTKDEAMALVNAIRDDFKTRFVAEEYELEDTMWIYSTRLYTVLLIYREVNGEYDVHFALGNKNGFLY